MTLSGVDDLRETHDGDRVLQRYLAAVDVFQEADQLVVTAELGIVVFDVARREQSELGDLDVVDHRFEDPVARRVLVADRDQHQLFFLYLPDLSPSRIVAVLRPRVSSSAKIVE